MDKRSYSAMLFAVGLFLFIISLPGIPEQIQVLAGLLGMSEAEWEWFNYIGVSVGFILILFWLYPFWRRVLRFFSGDDVALDWPMIRNVIIVVAVLALGIYTFTNERPSFAWKHPTFPLVKQEESMGECIMRAIEAVGGRATFSAIHMRNKYRDACLAAKGFKLEQVDD